MTGALNDVDRPAAAAAIAVWRSFLYLQHCELSSHLGTEEGSVSEKAEQGGRKEKSLRRGRGGGHQRKARNFAPQIKRLKPRDIGANQRFNEAEYETAIKGGENLR